MFRISPQPNPAIYRSTWFHRAKGGYQYQRDGSYRVVQAILIFAFVGLLESYLIHHHKLNGLLEFLVPFFGMFVSIQVADYAFYRQAMRRS